MSPLPGYEAAEWGWLLEPDDDPCCESCGVEGCEGDCDGDCDETVDDGPVWPVGEMLLGFLLLAAGCVAAAVILKAMVTP